MASESFENDIFGELSNYGASFDPDIKPDNRVNVPIINDPYFDFNVSGPQRIIKWLLTKKDTSFKRCIINCAPGFGKTFLILMVVKYFSQQAYQEFGSQNRFPILILTFTTEIFLKELYTKVIIKGASEAIQGRVRSLLNKLDHSSNSIIRERLSENIKEEFKKILRQSSSYGEEGLCMSFQGHQQFVISVFGNTPASILEAAAQQVPLHELNEHLRAMHKKEEITINEEFVASLAGGYLIVDELQNMHHVDLNSRGITLLFILQEHDDLRFLAADGTLIQNLPEEIITIFQFCFPKQKFLIDDYFTKEHTIIPGTETRLVQYGAKSIISFPNNNISTPPLYFLGTPLSIYQKGQFVDQPWLVVKAYMNQRQTELYLQAINNTNYATGVCNIIAIGKDKKVVLQLNQLINFGKDYDPQFLDILREPKLSEISPKGTLILQTLLSYIFDPDQLYGKALMLGTNVQEDLNFIGSLLKSNGFIEVGTPEDSNTRCYRCGNILAQHKASHEFLPARFAAIHTYLEEKNSCSYILNQYSHPSNDYGMHIKVLLGSQMITLGHNLMATELVLTCSPPFSVSHTIQAISRTLRPDALKNNLRKSVLTGLIITAMDPDLAPAEGPHNTNEEMRLFEKITLSNKNMQVKSLVTQNNVMGPYMPTSPYFSMLNFTKTQQQTFDANLIKDLSFLFTPTTNSLLNQQTKTSSSLLSVLDQKAVDDMVSLILQSMRFIISEIDTAITIDQLKTGVRNLLIKRQWNPEAWLDFCFDYALHWITTSGNWQLTIDELCYNSSNFMTTDLVPIFF